MLEIKNEKTKMANFEAFRKPLFSEECRVSIEKITNVIAHW